MINIGSAPDGEEMEFIRKAAQVASCSTCLRSKCGCVIVKDGEIIGEGFNSPPNGLESQRRCLNDKSKYDIKVTDKICCIHAEQRAIMDALSKFPDKIQSGASYFIRLDKEGRITPAGKPYCTICSKFTLDSGVKEFVLLHEEGICIYDSEEYNDLSFNYKGV